MTKTVVKSEVHFEIPLSLAPIPSARRDPDRREQAEARITTAAKEAMAGRQAFRGPVEVTLAMAYAPSSSQRKKHAWRITAPCTWDLAKFVLPLLRGIVFEGDGAAARLVVEKSYGEAPLTTIKVAPLA